MKKQSLKSKLRSAFAAVLCAVLVIAGLPVAAVAVDTKVTPQALQLATISDMHYYPADLAPHEDDAGYEDFLTKLLCSNVNYETLDYILDKTFSSLEAQAIAKGLKYVVVTGDLTLNGEKQGHEALAAKLRAFEESTGLQVIVTNGNHDINNSKAASYSHVEVEKTSPQDFMEIYYEFGFSDAYHTFIDYKSVEDKQTIDSKAGMLSYSLQLEEGYRLIMLDAGHYSADVTEDGTDEKETSGGVTDELLAWLLAEIEDAKANGEIPLMATHWNMSGANYLHEYITVGFVIDEHYKLQEILADAGLHYVFSGHHHVSDIDITYSDKGEPMYSIITPTLTEFPAAYRVTSFDYNATDESIAATFNTYEIDGSKTVELNLAYTGEMPYSVTVYQNQYTNGDENGDAVEDSTYYLMRMVRNALLPFVDQIREAGSIIPFIEQMIEIDLEATIDELINGGIAFGGFELFTAKNIMRFLKDLDFQICKLLLVNPEKTFDEVIEPAVVKLLSLQMSEVPCTKFIDTLGFGSTERGGTLADLFMSVMYYMYAGNEDISDDAFMQDALANMKSGEIITPFVETIVDAVVYDVVADTLLANLEVNLTKLFAGTDMDIIPEFDTLSSLYYVIVALVDAGVFDYLTGDKEATFENVMRSLFDALMLALNGEPDTSYLHLLEIVLDLANLKYGSTIEEVIDYLLDEYVLADSMVDGIGGVMYTVVDSFCNDEDRDNNVTYIYDGPIEIIPTQDEMQIPSLISVTYGDDSASAFNISWYTKYSVSGTDIELYKADSAPVFKGKNSIPEGVGIKTATTEEVRSFNGVDVGVIGVMQKDRDVYRHVIQLTNLEPDSTYYYRIGDAKLGYWSETGTLKTAAGDDSAFTFFHFTDTQSVIEEQYNVWGTLLDDALEIYPDSAFIAHTGDFVDHGDNFLQWKWGLNTASDNLINMPLMPTAGNHEAYGTYAIDNYFSLSDGTIAIPQYTDTGVYYSYDYNNAHFIVLNTNDTNEDGGLSDNQVKWLQKDVAATDADWIILQMHKAVFSQGSHYGDDDIVALRNQLLKLMLELDIDLVLSGHDHVYMRTIPVGHYGASPATETVNIIGKDGIEYTATLDTEGTVFICGGSSGVKTYTAAFGETAEYFPNNYYAYPRADEQQVAEPMFSAITIDGTTLTFAAYTYNADGELYVCDKTALSKTKIVYMSGDADADGIFEASDARTALRLSVGLDWSTVSDLTLLAADFDGDGKIDAGDARRILRCSVGYEDLELVEVRSIFKGELDSRYE